MTFGKEEFRDLNRWARELPGILRRNRDQPRWQEIAPEDRERLQRVNEIVRTLLREVCSRQTTNEELAALAATQTREAFFDLLSQAAEGSLLRWAVTECVVLFFPPNVWLFVRAQRTLERMERSLPHIIPTDPESNSGPPKAAAAPRKTCGDPDPLRVELARNHCPLRGISARRKNDPGGARWAARQALRRDFCQRDCILILLEELGFRVREMESALGHSRSIIFDRMIDCVGKLKALLPANGKPAAVVPTTAAKGGTSRG